MDAFAIKRFELEGYEADDIIGTLTKEADQPSSASESLPVVKAWKVTSNASGLIAGGKIVPSEEVSVVSKVSGKVANVSVKEGSVVKKGDVLVTLEQADYQQQINQAQAAIAGAQAKLRDTKEAAWNTWT